MAAMQLKPGSDGQSYAQAVVPSCACPSHTSRLICVHLLGSITQAMLSRLFGKCVLMIAGSWQLSPTSGTTLWLECQVLSLMSLSLNSWPSRSVPSCTASLCSAIDSCCITLSLPSKNCTEFICPFILILSDLGADAQDCCVLAITMPIYISTLFVMALFNTPMKVTCITGKKPFTFIAKAVVGNTLRCPCHLL